MKSSEMKSSEMKKSGKLRKVTNNQFDVTTMESGRVTRMWFLWKRFPYGITSAEPYGLDFINAWIHHRFGKLIIKYRLIRENGWK